MRSADERFGTLLRRYRLAAGLTQEELAERAGLSFVSVGALERGDRQAPRFSTVNLLADALGLAPEERTGLRAAARPKGHVPPAPAATDPPPTNLPFSVTSFRGRELELEQLTQLVMERRLVTLCGVGGIGKTRLALETGRRITTLSPGTFPGGVWFVDLAPLDDPSLVDHQIARAMGIEVRPGTAVFDALVGALHDIQALLILDNCEHVLEAVAHVASRLIAACPRLHLLTTSRETLRIAGERVERLSALPLPEAGDDVAPSIAELLASPAVKLFLDRAADSGPAQAVDLEDPEAQQSLVTVARRLEGIPLAIELAAARMASLPLAALAQRLDDRFRLLSTGDRTARPRHQTLRAALDWSYDLLADSEAVLLDRLGVFAGSFTPAAAQSVCGDDLIAPDDVPELLASLVDKSLVIADVRSGAARYRLLEMIRFYSVEQLAKKPGERRRMARRHADYYRSVAERIDAAGAAFEPTEAFEGVLDDVRSALVWALSGDGDPDLAVSLVVALRWVFHPLSLNAEGTIWSERALAAIGERAGPRQEADLLRNIAMFSWWSDTNRTLVSAERAAALYRQLGDRPNLGNALAWHAFALYTRGERAEADRLAAEAVELVQARGQEHYRVLVLIARALTMPVSQAPARRRFLDEALALCDRHAPESRFAAPFVLSACAIVAFESGELERARDYSRRRVDQSPTQATRELALTHLAYYDLAAGDVDAARAAAREALIVPGTTSRAFFGAVRTIAGVAAHDGDPVTAAHLLGAVDALVAAASYPEHFADLEARRQAYALAQAALPDDARLATLLAEGRALTREQVTQLALAVTDDEWSHPGQDTST